MVSFESWTHIKILGSLIFAGATTVAGGGMWVNSVNDRVESNRIQIEENTDSLGLTVNTVIRMDERQVTIKQQLDRIERMLDDSR